MSKRKSYEPRHYGPGTCEKCGEQTISETVNLCPRHWEKKYHTAYPMLTWRTEQEKLAAWLSKLPEVSQ